MTIRAATVLLSAILCACLAAPAGAATTPDAGQARAAKLRVSLPGLARERALVCGRTRLAAVARADQRVNVRVRVRRRALRGRRVVLIAERCVAGRWRRAARRSVRSKGRRRIALGTAVRAGDELRVTAHGKRAKGRRVRSRPVYLRVSHEGDRAVELPVRFQVKNTNRSRVSCDSDGGSYTIAGRLVAPRSLLEARDAAVTLYLHEFSWGRFFWTFPDREYDYAAQLAARGHASVAIDRLGYDESSHPDGSRICMGSQADVAHQVVEALRSGNFSADGGGARRFSRVALAGHSIGGLIAEIEAYSFRDIDALMLFAHADQGVTPRSTEEGVGMGFRCRTSPESAEPGTASGYAYFSDTAEEFRYFMFRTAEARIADAATAMRNRDPCGEINSFVGATAANQQNVPSIEVPVLLMYGTSDPVFDQPKAGEDQRRLFSGSKDVTLRFFEGQAHGLNLERRAPEVRATADEWLTRRGF